MFASKFPGRGNRTRHTRLSALERLETRTVLNYTALGSSLPDLTVVGSVPAVAAYGGPITLQVDVSNIGHSSMVEPFALVPNSVSTADAQPSIVGVYLSTNPHRFVRSQSVRIGGIDVPYLRQNSTFQLEGELAMPDTQPRGFPGSGGQLWVWFRADDTNTVSEIDNTNNVSRGAQSVQLFAPLPQLAIIALDVPPVISPGDAIAPSFKIANFGTVDTQPQGDVLVQIVASTDRNYGPEDIILGSYNIANIEPLANAPTLHQTVLGDVTLDNQPNILTIGGQEFTLPSDPKQYFIGVIADPLHTIRQISDLDGPRSSLLSEIQVVGPPIHGLPPANAIGTKAPTANIFPTPAFGLITSPFFPPDPTATVVAFATSSTAKPTKTTQQPTKLQNSAARRQARRAANQIILNVQRRAALLARGGRRVNSKK